jgi:hypothetical protein
MPFMRSESCSFIWQPKVVTWNRIGFVRVSANGGIAAASGFNFGIELVCPLRGRARADEKW